MTLRFGDHLLDLEWPFQVQENNPRFANFDIDYQDICACKIQEEPHPSLIKIQNVDEQSVISEDEKERNDSSQIIYESSQDQIDDGNGNKTNIVSNMNLVKKETFEYINTIDDLEKKSRKITNGQKKNKYGKNCFPWHCKNKKITKQQERGKYNILSEDLKKQIVDETKNMTMVEVAKKYNVSVNNICRWRKRCNRRVGAGRKVTDMDMQESPIIRKDVQMMAKTMSCQKGFKASKGWFERFYKRNKILMPNIQILTRNDYRQRTYQLKQSKGIQQSMKYDVKLEY